LRLSLAQIFSFKQLFLFIYSEAEKAEIKILSSQRNRTIILKILYELSGITFSLPQSKKIFKSLNFGFRAEFIFLDPSEEISLLPKRKKNIENTSLSISSN